MEALPGDVKPGDSAMTLALKHANQTGVVNSA
jgi:hypothetical protein